MREIRLLIADDHTLIRDGLKKIIQFDDGVSIIGEAANGEEAVALALREHPHVILMDINMPLLNGIEATKIIKEKQPQISIIILTIHDDQEYIFELFNYGVSGYVLKDISADHLLAIIKRIAAGEIYIDPRMSGKLVGEWRQRSLTQEAKNKLTAREQEILAEIARGQNNKSIASKLFISEKTVKNHVTNIFRKLEVNDRTQAVVYAIKNKLVEL